VSARQPLDLTPSAIAALLQALPTMPVAEKAELLADLELLEQKTKYQRARDSFPDFCRAVYPDWKEGPHHRHLAPKLHDVALGTKTRMSVSMPPRFGKSESIAFLFVAWYLGHHPGHHIMMVTHTASLSADFGRKVRNLIDAPTYQAIFPDTKVSRDKTASDNWTTTLGGKYLAIGIGANVAGHGAHLLICDDLVSEQVMLTSSPDAAFATAWEYVQVGPLQRLMPNGRIVMIACMTAETRVLMADGTEKEMQHIKVGDSIATYDAGKISTSRVTNWIKHPHDFIYKIRTTSGRIVRANKRHPFLVDRNGVRTWVRVQDLKVGDCLVEAVQPQAAGGHTKPGDCAAPATNESSVPKEESELNATPGTGGSGKGLYALLMGAAVQSPPKDFVTAATARSTGRKENGVQRLLRNARAISSIGTAFLCKFTTTCWRRKEAAVPYASSLPTTQTHGLGRSQSCMSTTAMTPVGSEDCSATTATWPSDTRTQKQDCWPRPSTYATTASAIAEIAEDGFEPVFDMEVARTENFIANGVVSHNTRWGKKDPIGRALAWAQNNPDSPQWDEVRFPAILPSGKSLWPEQWPIEQLLAKKASMFPQFWAAQYMQEPTSEEGAVIKRDWWKIWESDDPPKCEYIMMSVDTAHDTKSSSDYTAITTWGVWSDERRDYKPQLILLDAFKDRMEFPELKKIMLKHYKNWEPDAVIIEKKAAGAPLIQELRAVGVPVQEFSPSRGNDKRVRLNAIADLFSSGIVWVPDTRWAREVMDEVAEFPNGEHDDYVDTTSQALLRFRQGGFVTLDTDDTDDDRLRTPQSRAYYRI